MSNEAGLEATLPVATGYGAGCGLGLLGQGAVAIEAVEESQLVFLAHVDEWESPEIQEEAVGSHLVHGLGYIKEGIVEYPVYVTWTFYYVEWYFFFIVESLVPAAGSAEGAEPVPAAAATASGGQEALPGGHHGYRAEHLQEKLEPGRG